MQVQRTKHSSAYVQIPNVIARHGRLSLEAVGLLVRLLSLPDGTGATVEKICAQVPNGRRSVSKAMNELVEVGYVKRAKLQDPETGRWVTVTTVSDTPESETSPTNHMATVGETTGRAVGGSPKGEKTESKKDTTPTPVQAQEAAPLAPETPEQGGNGETAFLHKIGREMAREGRRILERLSLHKSLPLSDQEIGRLAPRVVPWLREDYRSEDILQCLTQNLPEHVSSVPGLITHRLKNFTPERTAQAAAQAPSRPVERAQCEVCEAPFRLGHQGGVCRSCQDELNHAATFLAAS
ncbi:helix-turn-helix domain-containing protein [Streptomyces sp. V3I7]|uniref:helix-turn-helix domain-containing protein n=1 Tax=Streptomyces sp. V3I7 TaxID=3042278 RepID=UPI00278AD274|nr:helix-turn-helix domain-containing protein [Streptomyces sp. V3I7]MDQ0993049.1 putative transcriptional regulator [Streptomyces sp. V3I7]